MLFDPKISGRFEHELISGLLKSIVRDANLHTISRLVLDTIVREFHNLPVITLYTIRISQAPKINSARKKHPIRKTRFTLYHTVSLGIFTYHTVSL